MNVDVFSGSIVSAGFVRCHPSDPAFEATDIVPGYRIVFPRRAVWIRTSRSRRYVSHPGVVECYNPGDEYTRQALDPRGDSTEWYGVSEPALRDIVARHDPTAADARLPLRRPFGPTDGRAYAAQRVLFHRLSTQVDVEPLEVEETVLAIVDASLARAGAGHRPAGSRPVTRVEREIAERTNAVLSRLTRQQITLAGISREVAVSVFHLSRIFRRVTGDTLAKRHVRLRLISSLEPLLESDATIADIATRHGFASHSHFGSVFHREFGVAPSTLRRLPSRARREALARDRVKPAETGRRV